MGRGGRGWGVERGGEEEGEDRHINRSTIAKRLYLGTEKERWRQFCTQYAKSVAFKFAESWRQYTSNPEHLGHIHVLTVDVVEHFSKTLHDELLERLNASSAANSLQSSTHVSSNSGGRGSI